VFSLRHWWGLWFSVALSTFGSIPCLEIQVDGLVVSSTASFGIILLQCGFVLICVGIMLSDSIQKRYKGKLV
jgi:hypothetical protein